MPRQLFRPAQTGTPQSPQRIVIRRGRVIDPSQGLDGIGDLAIVGGRVEKVVVGAIFFYLTGTTEIDASGLVVCPGFIDLHCHLREPGYEDKETIATGTMAAARGGFTTVCCMPNTSPPVDRRSVVELLAEKIKAESAVSVLLFGTLTKGRSGDELSEMGELAEAGVAGFSDDGSPLADCRLMQNALRYSLMLDLPVSNHAEDTRLAAGGAMHEARVSVRLGLPGIPAAAEEVMVARDISLARETGGRLHVPHVSTEAAVNLVRAAKTEGIRVTAEATPHHLVLHDGWVAGERSSHLMGAPVVDFAAAAPYDTNTKVNPPLRSLRDVEAVLKGVLDGTIDAIATDHAPHTTVDKECEYGYAAFGISGLETALSSLMMLVRAGLVDLATVVERLTAGPARAIGIERGTLVEGAAADVVLLDPEEEWVVEPARLASKGKNTPLAGFRVPGRVIATLVEGEIKWQTRPF